MKLFKGTTVLISVMAGLAWADGTPLCTCPLASVKTSPVYFSGDVRLDALLLGISPAQITDGTLQFK